MEDNIIWTEAKKRAEDNVADDDDGQWMVSHIFH